MNATRSMNRYVALALPDYETAWAVDEATGMTRPCARIEPVTPTAHTPHGSSHRVSRRTFRVVCFPSPGINRESSHMEAARVEGLLTDAFTEGLDEAGAWHHGGQRTHPYRVPLYSYEGLPLHQAADEDRRVGFMRVVESPAFERFPDPNDDALFIVAGTVRCEWTDRVGRDPSGPTVENVTPNYVGGVSVEPGP